MNADNNNNDKNNSNNNERINLSFSVAKKNYLE